MPRHNFVPPYEQRNFEIHKQGMQLKKWIEKTNAMKNKYVLSVHFLLIDSRV